VVTAGGRAAGVVPGGDAVGQAFLRGGRHGWLLMRSGEEGGRLFFPADLLGRRASAMIVRWMGGRGGRSKYVPGLLACGHVWRGGGTCQRRL
jgi:hypothetical protein